MKTMVFGKTGETVSRLGFGTMRLPLLKSQDGDKPKVDEQQAIEMIRSSIDGGLSYIDTAYIYHDEESEVITGKALKTVTGTRCFLQLSFYGLLKVKSRWMNF